MNPHAQHRLDRVFAPLARIGGAVLIAIAVAACQGEAPPAPAAPPETASKAPSKSIPPGDPLRAPDEAPARQKPKDAPAVPGCAKGTQAVTLTTEDGVRLAADVHQKGVAERPFAVLLHMIPPHTKANFSDEFITHVMAAGYDVINVNRRGAEGSEGVAEQGYKGATARLDAAAAVQHMLGLPCRGEDQRYVMVGASNGTTGMLDHTVWAKGEGRPGRPIGLVYLSGGSYTEAQNRLREHVSELGALPSLFAYPKAEAKWNREVAALDAPAWSFREYPSGHGTQMFDAKPEIIADVSAFLANRRFKGH